MGETSCLSPVSKKGYLPVYPPIPLGSIVLHPVLALPSLSEDIFISDELNDKKQDENDHDVGAFIDETQINAVLKYENKMEKTVRYTLTIQRSTGRFAENFRLESEKIPFSESTGYCIYR